MTPNEVRKMRQGDLIRQQIALLDAGATILVHRKTISAKFGLGDRTIDNAVERGDLERVVLGPRVVRFTSESVRRFGAGK